MKIKYKKNLKNWYFTVFVSAVFYVGLLNLSYAGECSEAFADPDSFAFAMSKGLHITNAKQAGFFELYRNWFGDKTKDTGGKALHDVLGQLEKYPELSKLPMREQILTVQVRERAKPESLTEFLKSFTRSAGRIRNKLFQISANYGFWATLLAFPEISARDGLSKQEQKTLRKERKKNFFTYLDSSPLNQETREFIEDPRNDYRPKVMVLYQALNQIREDLTRADLFEPSNNKVIQNISQAMVDLVHTAGFGNKLLTEMLKSKDPLENLEGIRAILSERDIVAMDLGFEGHFAELQSSLRTKKPVDDFTGLLRKIEKDVESGSYTVKGSVHFRLRSLSLIEAPFRGCLGGSDCSTRTYFYKALDPNFLYFTLTDSAHRSSGHITLVLGEAKSEEGGPVNTAFVDKIQNIPNNLIIPALQGIALSLKERGYTLGIPKATGNHTGLSNEFLTSSYVKSEVLPYLGGSLTNFRPHHHGYFLGSAGYSRAYESLDMLRWTRDFDLRRGQGVEISPGEIFLPRSMSEDLEIPDLYKAILLLEKSEKEGDQIRFLSNLLTMREIKELNISEKQVESILKSRIRDFRLSFKVRKLAFFRLIEFRQAVDNRADISFLDISFLERHFLRYFSEKERDSIIGEMSNWKHSRTQYKRDFIKDLSLSKWVLIINHAYYRQRVLSATERKILDINVRVEDYNTPLMLASKKGNKGAVRFLIEAGADIKAVNRLGNTALLLASENGHTEVVRLLIEAGADVGFEGGNWKTALLLASENGHTEVVRLLIEKGGVDAHAVSHSRRETALLLASENGHTEVVRLLIEAGADIKKAVNRDKKTALLLASENGHTEVIRLLIEAGADVNAKSGYRIHSETALLFMARIRYRGMENAFDISPFPVRWWRSLTRETAVSRYIETMKFLIKQGADVNTQNRNGDTALILAVEGGNMTAIRLLIKKGADVNIQNEVGDTALILAVRRGNMTAVRLLIKKGADVNIQNEVGDTALMSAVRYRNMTAVRLLIKKGADVNIQAENGDSAYTLAKQREMRRLMELLEPFTDKSVVRLSRFQHNVRH